ncbi:conjugative transposon protein TraN [Flammeovirgaceae bacterium]
MIYYINTMNTITKIMLGALLLFTLKDAISQTPVQVHPLEVTYNKTSSLLFPAVIKSVDRGSLDVLAQKAKGVENVLQLKASREDFPETNLTVITADGAIHEFTINYSREPGNLILRIGDVQEEPGKFSSMIFKTQMTETDLENYSRVISNTKRSVRFIRERKYKMALSLNGIYVKNDVIFYHFRIVNQSNLNYDVDFLRFYIKDQVKAKRTASQEVDVTPIYVYGNDGAIKGRTSTDVVYALEKFTIPDAKLLTFEMFERNGGRKLKLQVKNKTIVNARLIE